MSRSLDRQYRGRRRDRSTSYSRSRSGSRASTNRDRIRCFVRECLTRQENREIEEIQPMFSLDDEQTALQTSLMDIYDGVTIKPTDNRDGLNLSKVEVFPPHFYLLVKIQVETIKLTLDMEIVRHPNRQISYTKS